MSQTVLAAVMAAPRVPVELRELPLPELPVGGALLRTGLSEVCGTDVHLWHGRLSGVPYPIIPGHVRTGTLEPFAGRCRRGRRPLREGDRVAFFDVHRTCGRCLACTVHRTPTRCPVAPRLRHHRLGADGLFGGWAQQIYLEPGVSVAKLPDAVTFEAYIGGGCGLLTAVHIIDRARIGWATRSWCRARAPSAQRGRAGPAGRGRAGDLDRRPDDRLALASDMGADDVIPTSRRRRPKSDCERVLDTDGRARRRCRD